MLEPVSTCDVSSTGWGLTLYTIAPVPPEYFCCTVSLIYWWRAGDQLCIFLFLVQAGVTESSEFPGMSATWLMTQPFLLAPLNLFHLPWPTMHVFECCSPISPRVFSLSFWIPSAASYLPHLMYFQNFPGGIWNIVTSYVRITFKNNYPAFFSDSGIQLWNE